MAKSKVAGVYQVLISATAAAAATANFTAYVDTVSGAGKVIQPLDVTAFTDTAERVIPGIESSQDVTLQGAFDSTGSSDGTLVGLVGTAGTLILAPFGTASGARKITIPFVALSYIVSGAVKERLNYTFTVKQDGTAVLGTY